MAQPFCGNPQSLVIRHPGGVGDILLDADGGSWLKGEILDDEVQVLLASA